MGTRSKPKRVRRSRSALALSTIVLGMALAQPTQAASAQERVIAEVRHFRATREKQILEEFARLLALPNVATNVADVDRNAQFITNALQARGFKTRLIRAAEGTPAAIYGERSVPGAKRTLVFYAHYDGQPVSQAGWRSDPFKPVVREGNDARTAVDVNWRAAPRLDPEWRIYARSASDDKVAVQAMLTALDALRAQGRQPSANVKLFYEGEEEQGSPHLEAILNQARGLLSADLFLLGDGPRHQSGDMQLFFGARGTTQLELTVYGPLRPLHDGLYGNWAPNPAVMLTHLLDQLRDEDGHILVTGFYDDVIPLTSGEQAALAALPDIETQLRADLALGRTETSERLANAVMRPALNIRGISVGDVGPRASNTIFPEARASIDFRLVPEQLPERVQEEVETYLRNRGWTIIHEEPGVAIRRANARLVKADWKLGYQAYRTDMDAPAPKALEATLGKLFGGHVVMVPRLGGSVPMSTFASVVKAPIIGLPLANYDNNQHAANENLRLQNLWDAIDIYATLLSAQ